MDILLQWALINAPKNVDFVQKYHTFDFLFNFISTFETINKSIIFLVNNLFIMVYNYLQQHENQLLW